MVRLVLAIALAAGCYTPQLADCVDTCGSSQLCPDGLACTNGFCRTAGAVGACAVPVDAAIRIDSPAATCPPVPIAQGCAQVGSAPVAPSCMVVCAAQPGTQAQMFAVGSWHIASITTAAEQTAALTAANGMLLWIGLAQMPGQTMPQAAWGWAGVGLPVTFTAWAANQPDDGNGTEDGAEQCGVLGPGGWGDEPCSGSHPFLIKP